MTKPEKEPNPAPRIRRRRVSGYKVAGALMLGTIGATAGLMIEAPLAEDMPPDLGHDSPYELEDCGTAASHLEATPNEEVTDPETASRNPDTLVAYAATLDPRPLDGTTSVRKLFAFVMRRDDGDLFDRRDEAACINNGPAVLTTTAAALSEQYLGDLNPPLSRP